MQSTSQKHTVDQHNQSAILRWLENESWDGILVGNLDLLGVELLHWLVSQTLPILHHIGFVHSPYEIKQQPKSENYYLLAASHAVKSRLIKEGICASDAPIVYPGARTDLFGPGAIPRALPNHPYRTKGNPFISVLQAC